MVTPRQFGIAGLLVILMVRMIAMPVISAAQPRGNIPRVGVLVPGDSAVSSQSCLTTFQHGLRDLGYVEGQHILFAYRYAENRPERLPALAAELVRLTPDLLWTYSSPAVRAAKQATTTIPIVAAISSELVEQGLVESLARPGGNLTGLEMRDTDVLGQRLELLKDAVPTISRVAILVNPANPLHKGIPHNIAAEAQALGVQLQRVEASSPEAFEEAFATVLQRGAEALMLMEGPPFGGSNLRRILAFAREQRLPTVSGGRHYAEAGVLLAYGANAYDLCQRSAIFVDKLLKGAMPAELPVERAHKFYLYVNLKTAATLGLTLPPTVLFRADEVLK